VLSLNMRSNLGVQHVLKISMLPIANYGNGCDLIVAERCVKHGCGIKVSVKLLRIIRALAKGPLSKWNLKKA
jgi:hypothetical protein